MCGILILFNKSLLIRNILIFMNIVSYMIDSEFFIINFFKYPISAVGQERLPLLVLL